jgi:hypothetical protein
MSERVCSVEGCDRKHMARSWCAMHYQRWYRTGSLEVRQVAIRVCSITGCGRKHLGRGMCRLHYARWRKHGSPFTVRRSGGRNADFDAWTTSRGYQRRWLPDHPLAQADGQVYEHQVVALESFGGTTRTPHQCWSCGKQVRWRSTLQVVFLDGDRQNVDPSNLAPSCIGCARRHANRLRGAAVA